MLSSILKAAVAAVIAVLLIVGFCRFYKKTRNLTKSKIKAELKRLNYFRLSAFCFALIVCCAYAIAVYFDTSKQAGAVIWLNYAEATLGQNANGTRYNMSEIICDEVLERVIEKGGFEDVSVSDLKSCLGVSPLTQGNSYSKEKYHISTEFYVTYEASKKLQKYNSDTVMQLLCNSYRDYYFDKYVNDFQIQSDDLVQETKDLDYIDAVNVLSNKANKILNYLYGLREKSASFISESGATFASVAAKVDTLNTTQINGSLYSFILQNGVSTDSRRLIRRYSYINSQSDFEKQKSSQSYTITNDAIAKYDKDMARIVLVPTWDSDGQYYMGRTKIGIDTLSVQSVSYSNAVASIEKGIKDNNLKLEKFTTATGNTTENRDYTSQLIESTAQSIEKLAEEARQIGQEYYSNQMNQCLTATVYSASVLSWAKTLVLVFLAAYVACWLEKSSVSFGGADHE